MTQLVYITAVIIEKKRMFSLPFSFPIINRIPEAFPLGKWRNCPLQVQRIHRGMDNGPQVLNTLRFESIWAKELRIAPARR